MTSLDRLAARRAVPPLRRLALLGVLVTPAAMLPAVAHAQLSLGSGGSPAANAASGVGKSGQDDADKKPAPPASIPGARANEPVVPASKTAGELDPNAALFDAIDRGDLTAAREAVSRGADLNAKNVLGQRPIDMSIDLSRNDITFLLLSMRAQNGDEAPAVEGDGSADAAPAPAPTQVASTGARRGRHRHQDEDSDVASAAGGSGQGSAEMSVSTAAPAAPQPSSGFLGFGSH